VAEVHKCIYALLAVFIHYSVQKNAQNNQKLFGCIKTWASLTKNTDL